MSRRRFIGAGLVAVFTVAALVSTSGADGTIGGTVNVTGQPSSGEVLVYLQQTPGTFTAPAKPLEMDQKQYQFIPRVLPVLAGTTVRFLNSDRTPHNVFSPDNEKYNLGTWETGRAKTYTFGKCVRFPCVYTQLCRVHPEMMGFVVVLQNPFYALSDKNGSYKIDNIPPATYTVAVWHPRARAQPQPVTVDAAKPARVDFVLAR